MKTMTSFIEKLQALGVTSFKTSEFSIEFKTCQQDTLSATMPLDAPMLPTSTTAGDYTSYDLSPRSPPSLSSEPNIATPEDLEAALYDLGTDLV